MKRIVTLLLWAVVPYSVQAQAPSAPSAVQEEHPTPAKEAVATPATLSATRTSVAEAPKIDGVLDDAVWESAPAITAFKQRDPIEGATPSEETLVRVLYDDEALYIGARLFDSHPDSIIARLGRRDAEIEADLFGFFIDPYFDRRSGYYFGVNAGGTLYDGVLYNDEWDDNSWDGVWQGQARIDEEGWTVEMRIPYSQLRFQKKAAHTWGINFRRDIARHNEQDFLVYTPKKESGFVSRFVPLVGIEAITPPRRVEVLPYVTTKATYDDVAPENPFRDGSDYTPAVGADVKIGIGSNLTLDGTVNPDFGQVEVDPAVVNLSDTETFFEEKRPFFIEGASLFNFGQGGARNYWGFNWSGGDLFYSRRIGRAPQGSLPENDYADVPAGTRILGAAKLTGKLGKVGKLGMVHAVTAQEMASFTHGGERARMAVEPLTYYGVFRGQKEIDDGRQGIGFMSTVAQRSFGGDGLGENRLREQFGSGAYVGGVDGWTFLDEDKEWVVTGYAAMSHLRGTPGYITDVQRGSVHYLQRPDADHVDVDTAAAALTGWTARVYLNKQQGKYFSNSAIGVISPRFNSNDLGFISRTDVINGHLGAGRQWPDPNGWRRQMEAGGALFQSRDFAGNVTWTGVFHFGYVQFLNYYNVFWNLAYNPETVNNRRTRGGPLTLTPPGYQVDFGMGSDSRKAWVIGAYFNTYQSGWSRSLSLSVDVQWKPAPNLSLSLSPELSLGDETSQWVGAFDDALATETFGTRYVFAELDQTTLSSSIRLDWTFTPKLSLQVFLQPLISSGDYFNFKELERPKSYDFLVYGEAASTFDTETFTADPDGPSGPAAPLDLDDPHFNFVSLRGNAVLRWEYRPGSTLYLAWTQRRSDSADVGTFQFDRSLGRLWDSKPENIFLIKLNYWLNL